MVEAMIDMLSKWRHFGFHVLVSSLIKDFPCAIWSAVAKHPQMQRPALWSGGTGAERTAGGGRWHPGSP